MSNYIATNTELTSIANAIRAKSGGSSSLEFPEGFVSEIGNIPSGGGAETEALTIVQNGTYTAPTGKAYSPITVNVPNPWTVVDTLDEHGGTIRTINTQPQQWHMGVTFYDYDGTVLHRYTKAEFLELESMPANPTHEGLTSQGWNWTLSDAKTYVTTYGGLNIGQMYVTTSGATEIDVVMQEGRLDPILTICPNGTISVDWGDDTTPDEVTGSSYTSRNAVSHTYAHAGNYTIKISKTSGSGYGFYGSTIYLLLRKNATSGSQNIVYANAIQNIRIGNDARIGSSSFCNCYSLASITIPSGVTSIGTNAFNTCYSLASITIPSSVTSIGNNAFQGCNSLASITIPSGVTSIGISAFYACYSLASITIPSSVTSIGSNAFNTCTSLASITIPSGVTSIGNNAFQGCNSLASVTIPSTVTSIGNNAFTTCFSLASITIPSSVTSIGNNAFQGCNSLASITIPSGVTSIGINAFQGCYSLASITIPSTVTSIGNNAFQYCYSLASITIPSTVTSIGNNAFQYCYSLASITIPSGVTSIGNDAFQGCNSLASVTIPSTVTSIGNNAFQSCYGVAEYHFESETAPTGGTTMFVNIVSDCIIYVPYSADHSILNAYKTATNWSTYASYMQEEPQ